MSHSNSMNRREFQRAAAAIAASAGTGMILNSSPALASSMHAGPGHQAEWKPKYILASCMYGYEKVETLLPEVAKTGATAIDVWPKVHGNQREQIEEMGIDGFADLLKKNRVQLGCITQYPLGPFGLEKEFAFAKKLGCKMLVTGSKGPKGQKGTELKRSVAKFIESMKPHVEAAEEHDVCIAIENHSNSLIHSPESLKWFGELNPSDHLGIALAPYHLPQDTKIISGLIDSLENQIKMFYAWQHGLGCMKKLPKDQELLQMPGRGKLDFKPLLESLAKFDYSGWVEIFMHPVPRGIAILDSVDKVTAEINLARKYLTRQLAKK